MRWCAQSSQRSTCPPSAEVRQVSIAAMTFSWPRPTWPALALRHATPWARKTSATPGLRSGGRATGPRSGGRRSLRQVEAEPLERALDVADRADRHAGVERGRLQLGVAEQHLDHANVGALFEQVGGKAMPQRMRRHALGDARQILGGGDGAVELTGGDRIDRVLAWEEPDLRSRRMPPVAQQFEQLRREHHGAIPLTLALLDPQRHALAVDIGHLEVRDLANSEAGAIRDAARGTTLAARPR